MWRRRAAYKKEREPQHVPVSVAFETRCKSKKKRVKRGVKGEGKLPAPSVWINRLVALDCLIHYKVVEQGQ
jgi:hypothetical protein